MRAFFPPSLLALFGILALAFGCDEQPLEYPAVRPLFDALHAPDLEAEAGAIALPPSLSGNRFLSGWQAWRDGERVVLSPTPGGGRIEIIRLVAEERRLVLDLRDGDPLDGSVRVRAGERELGTFPWRDPLEIPIPADLPLGRLAIDLVPVPAGAANPRGAAQIPNVVNAAVRPIQPSGALKVEGRDLIQAGSSRVETVIRATGETDLLGTFVPPEKPRSGQRWQLTLEREDGSNIRRFYWSASFWNRLRGERGFRLPLRGAKGLVRVRLDAWGDGPPGRWRDLSWAGPPEIAEGYLAARPAADLVPGAPPRLVVVYVMDALRADAVGAFGGPPGGTPTIDGFGREGLIALRHRANSPNTLPSTKTLFTGHAYLSRGGWKLGPEDGPTLAEAFGRAGYHTGLFSGNVYVSPAYSTDRGFEHDAPEVLIEGYSAQAKPPYNDNAERVNAAALAWLRGLPPGSRAFLYLHVIHPHNPYDPPQPFRSQSADIAPAGSSLDGSTETLTGIKQGRLEPDEAGRARLRGLYQGSLAYADDQLGRFAGELAKIVPPTETLFAVTADHGEELFDHGGVLHGYTLNEEMLHIPLALRWAGRLRPGKIEEPTDTRDLHATLVDACGLRDPDGKPLPSEGRSLLRRPLPIPEGEPLHFAAASSVKGGIYSIQSKRWKLIWAPRTGIGWGMGEGAGRSRDPEYLFDLASDPGERINLAGKGEIEAEWLRGRLLAWIARAQPEAEGGEAPVDRETLDRLRALGYVN
ncbi:MAG: sulfatase-like hydrolase/transferase [Acidobacteriota bacterium]